MTAAEAAELTPAELREHLREILDPDSFGQLELAGRWFEAFGTGFPVREAGLVSEDLIEQAIEAKDGEIFWAVVRERLAGGMII